MRSNAPAVLMVTVLASAASGCLKFRAEQTYAEDPNKTLLKAYLIDDCTAACDTRGKYDKQSSDAQWTLFCTVGESENSVKVTIDNYGSQLTYTRGGPEYNDGNGNEVTWPIGLNATESGGPNPKSKYYSIDTFCEVKNGFWAPGEPMKKWPEAGFELPKPDCKKHHRRAV